MCVVGREGGCPHARRATADGGKRIVGGTAARRGAQKGGKGRPFAPSRRGFLGGSAAGGRGRALLLLLGNGGRAAVVRILLTTVRGGAVEGIICVRHRASRWGPRAAGGRRRAAAAAIRKISIRVSSAKHIVVVVAVVSGALSALLHEGCRRRALLSALSHCAAVPVGLNGCGGRDRVAGHARVRLGAEGRAEELQPRLNAAVLAVCLERRRRRVLSLTVASKKGRDVSRIAATIQSSHRCCCLLPFIRAIRRGGRERRGRRQCRKAEKNSGVLSLQREDSQVLSVAHRQSFVRPPSSERRLGDRRRHRNFRPLPRCTIVLAGARAVAAFVDGCRGGVPIDTNHSAALVSGRVVKPL